MQIDRIIFPIQALGPGDRLVIWTVGCSKHCFHCSNPELWKQDVTKSISIENILSFVKKVASSNRIDGITFTGGDPLEQAEEMRWLLPKLREIVDDILVYTGYTLAELKSMPQYSGWLETNISVLIDGRYEDEKNKADCVLRGSMNQQIIYFDEKYKELYEAYMSEGRKIQNVFHSGRLISVGIHEKG